MSSTNQQKCHCNLIVNEMLSFVQNKLAIMNPDILVRVCSSTFSKEDIENAMSLLSDIPTEIIQANKEGKYKDLYDIIKTLKSLDPEKAPLFVARDINKLPIATNANKLLLKENLDLEKEIKVLKDSMVNVDQLLLEFAKIACGQKVYVAKYDYNAYDKDEVSFRQGDLISNVSKCEGWMKGQVLRTGRYGMLPANYVTVCKR